EKSQHGQAAFSLNVATTSTGVATAWRFQPAFHISQFPLTPVRRGGVICNRTPLIEQHSHRHQPDEPVGGQYHLELDTAGQVSGCRNQQARQNKASEEYPCAGLAGHHRQMRPGQEDARPWPSCVVVWLCLRHVASSPCL